MRSDYHDPHLNRVSAANSAGETPGPIPNPEAKPCSADGTALVTGWESRTPPDIFSKGHPITRVAFRISIATIAPDRDCRHRAEELSCRHHPAVSPLRAAAIDAVRARQGRSGTNVRQDRSAVPPHARSAVPPH